MFVAAYDDRVLTPSYFIPFIQNTTRFCDLHFISPANVSRKDTFANSEFKTRLVVPRSLKGYLYARKLFDASFVNYSTNRCSFERACFHRWFALNAATSSLSDSSFICLLDTDFLIGMSPSHVLSRCMSKIGGENIHFIAEWAGDEPVAIGPEITIMTKAYLFGFCKYLLTTYFSPGMKSQLCGEYFDRIGNGLPGGICDMRALAAYSRVRSNDIFNLRKLSDSLILDNFNTFLGSEVGKNESWKISFKSGMQSLHFNDELKTLIGIHFQGNAKLFMHLACRDSSELTRNDFLSYLARKRTFVDKFVSKFMVLINDLAKLLLQ
jgi:hypothetical protein